MFGASLLLAGAEAGAAFVGAQSVPDNPVTGQRSRSDVLSTLGARAGDLAVVAGQGGFEAADGAFTTFWRVLTAGDVAGRITTSEFSTGFLLLLYRGATSAAGVGGGYSDGSAPFVVPGFIRASTHAGLVVFSQRSGVVAPASSPPTMIQRVSRVSGNDRVATFDRLYPANDLYAGEDIVFGGIGPSFGTIIELRGNDLGGSGTPVPDPDPEPSSALLTEGGDQLTLEAGGRILKED